MYCVYVLQIGCILCIRYMVYGILCISFGAMVFANGVEQQLIEVFIRVQCAM
jgi:hypothetical protein